MSKKIIKYVPAMISLGIVGKTAKWAGKQATRKRKKTKKWTL